MRLTAPYRGTQLPRSKTSAAEGLPRARLLLALCLLRLAAIGSAALAQEPATMPLLHHPGAAGPAVEAHTARARRFLAGRSSAALAMTVARQQHAAMLQAQLRAQATSPLSASWQPVGPNQIASVNYGTVTGRVTAIAIDPADTTGNTVYLGTTGGGVWKSTNAAGASSSVTFAPLTDTLPVFNANSGTTAIPSLSIGAVSVQNGVILAGTGDPNDSTDSFYGSGILRSTDGGVTWTLIQSADDGVYGVHNFLGLSVAGFAWSSTSPGVVVAAISDSLEGDLVNAGDQNSVRGLYYSSDSGATWQMSVVMDGSQTVQTPQATGGNVGGNSATAVVWNPIRKLFFAAVRYHGYYESSDGVTWKRLAQQPGTSLSLTACPTNPGTTGNLSCPLFRGALAVQPVTGDIFALTVNSSNLDQGLWQDVCAYTGSACGNAVTFGKQLVSTSLEKASGDTTIPQADYNMALAAVPTGIGTANPDTLLFVGTVDLYRCSLSSGCSFRNTTNAINGCAAPAMVPSAQHAIASLSSASLSLLYLGNDGGLWRSTDGVNEQGNQCSSDDANHFQNLNSGLGSLAEIISFAQDPTDPSTLLTGLGANGSAGTSTAASTTVWPQFATGEGGTVAIDQNNSSNWYLSTAEGVSIRYCGSGSSCTASDFTGGPTIGLTQVSNDASLIDPPWLLDPAQSTNVLIGTCRAWRGPAQSGTIWTSANAISTMFSGAQNSACTTNPVVRSLAAAGAAASGAGAAQNEGSTVLYAGMAGALDGGGSVGGHLFSTTAAGAADSTTVWTDLTSSSVTNDTAKFNPGGFDLSSVVADLHDATGKTLYVTVMGFVSGTGGGHVYRSIDGGAHWTNISSNLPNAPANSIVVDPNDANTLYVALDTGVYVTTQVATCTSGNCWSIYGLGLPNAPVVQLAVAGAMDTGDGRFGELRAATYGRGIWQLPLLTAAAAPKPAISLSPASLTFGSQAVNTSSASQSITVTNTGNAPLIVSSVAITGDFTETDTCAAPTLAANASCAIQIVFLPTAIGTRTGLLTVYGNVTGGQATASLSGVATAPSNIVLNPIALSFPSTVIGATATAENITISNTGGTPATLQTPTIVGIGDFKISANTCGATLAASTGCTVAITFTPTASGTRTGTFTITDSAGTQNTSLTGIGTSPATDALSLSSLSFAPQQIGTVSAAQPITLTNSGDVALTLIAAQTKGDFSVVNGCGNSLNAHSTCQFAVSYVPANVGLETGALTIADRYRSQSVSLSGTGTAPPGVSLAPTGTMNFLAIGVGITSTAQTVTLTNNNAQTLTIASLALAGDFAIVPGSNTCGTTLAANTACTLQVAFTPKISGVRSGLLTVTDNAANSPQTLSLTGVGVDFSLTASNSSDSVASGKPAVYSLLLTSASGTPGSATFTCSGIPANATCVIIPANPVNLGTGTVVITVTVATGVTPTASLSPRRTIWVALILPLSFGLFGARCGRGYLSRLLCLIVLCGFVAATGCGSGRMIPATSITTSPPTPTPTPSGTSTIVVSATSAGLVRAVDLTLIVQ